MAYHTGYSGQWGNAKPNGADQVRYGVAPNTTTSGSIDNGNGIRGTSWNSYSDGYSGWVNSGSTAYSAHGRGNQGLNSSGRLDLNQQSALGFAPANVTSFEVGQIFNLGRMAHLNNPVAGLSNSWFRGEMQILFMGMELHYQWRLHETPNNDRPETHPNNDDLVDFLNQISDQTFQHNGITYTLVVHGFREPNRQNVCEPIVTDLGSVKNLFRTTETRTTYGCLYASVEQVRDLTIVKKVEAPYGAPAGKPTFGFTAASTLAGSGWAATPNFSLTDGASRKAPYNSGETLTVTEAPLPADWKLTDIQCLDGGGKPVQGITTNLATGQLVVRPKVTTDNAVNAPITCTYTNTYIPTAELTLVKQVDSTGQTAPVATPQDWTLSASGQGATASEKLTGKSGVNGRVIAGTYSLAEEANNPNTTAGYAMADGWSCVTKQGAPVDAKNEKVTVAAGQQVVCTVKNVYQTGALEIVKAFDESVPDSADGVNFKGNYQCVLKGKTVASGTWSTTGAGPAELKPAAGMPKANQIPVGAECSVTEADLPAGEASGLPNTSWLWSAPAIDGPVVVAKGDTKRVTVTNSTERQLGAVVWRKTDVTGNRLGGSEWTLTGPDSFAHEFKLPSGKALEIDDCDSDNCDGVDRDVKSGEFRISGLPFGKYSLTEVKAPAGYYRLSNPIEFEITAKTPSLTFDLGGLVNHPMVGPTLPLTGGIGRDAFSIAGMTVTALGGLAVAALYRRKLRAARA